MSRGRWTTVPEDVGSTETAIPVRSGFHLLEAALAGELWREFF